MQVDGVQVLKKCTSGCRYRGVAASMQLDSLHGAQGTAQETARRNLRDRPLELGMRLGPCCWRLLEAMLALIDVLQSFSLCCRPLQGDVETGSVV
jgi:hypothetical protein